MTFVPNNYIIWVFLSTPSARRATHAGSVSDAEYDISIHALREEGDYAPGKNPYTGGYFYPRPPRGGRPYQVPKIILDGTISIHALREEGDDAYIDFYYFFCPFLSTPSARRATRFRLCTEIHLPYFYPRPPRGGRLLDRIWILKGWAFLSTPSARRATEVFFLHFCFPPYFYPRPPRGGRPPAAIAVPSAILFLSTPSARRATDSGRLIPFFVDEDFYPRPPRGGRPRTV